MTEKKPTPGSEAVDALIAAYGAQESEYTFSVPKFGEVTARRLTDASEMVRLDTEVDKYNRLLSADKQPPDLADYKGTDYSIIILAVYGSALLVTPKFSFRDMLRLAKHAGKGFLALTQPILDATNAEDILVNDEKIESEGNE